MDIFTPNHCLWNSLGLYEPAIDTDQNFRTTRSKSKPIVASITRDFNENEVRAEETNDGTCFTKIKKPTKKTRRDSLHEIQYKNEHGNERPKKRKRYSKYGSKMKKLKIEPSVEEEQTLSDIYNNQLWREQMPVPRKLEMIPEEGVMRDSSRMKFRFIDFPDTIPLAKIKRRQQLAAQNGWKKITKKRLRQLDAILTGYLEKLNSEK